MARIPATRTKSLGKGSPIREHLAASMTGSDAATTRRPAPRLDAVALVVVFACIYAAIGQWTWYKIDGQITILRLAEQGLGHPRHLLADEVLRLFLGATRAVGLGSLSTYEAVRLFSVLCAALSGLVLHRCASRLGFSRLHCATAQVALCATPALVFYASIVEFHAPFLFFASVAFYACTRLGIAASRDSWATWCGAVLVGALSGIAFLQHASGQVLPALLMSWLVVLLVRNGRGFATCLTMTAIVALSHFAIAKGLPSLIRHFELLPRFAPVAPTDAGSWSYVSYHFDSMSWSELRHVPTTLIYEWALPFFSVSILAWFAKAERLRGARVGLLVALIPYLGVSFLLMRHQNEFGAYAIPCALLATLLAVSALPARFLLVLGLAALVGGIVNVRLHDTQVSGKALRHAVDRAGAFEDTVVIVATDAERDDALMALSHRSFQQFGYVDHFVGLADAIVENWLREQKAAGRRVVATAAAWTRILESQKLAGRIVGRETKTLEPYDWRWIELQ